MTLLDLGRLLRRYIALVIALPIVCAVGCFANFAMSNSGDAAYSATSNIVVSTHVKDVGGLAAAEARAYTNEDANVAVTSTIDEKTNTVTISATASGEEESIALANEVAKAVLDEAETFVPYAPEDPFNARIEKAEKATAAIAAGHMKYILAAFAAGLFLAICIIIVIDFVRRPITSAEGIQAATGLPVLGVFEGNDHDAERILANAYFASKLDSLQSVCLVPVGDEASIEQLRQKLDESLTRAGDSAQQGMVLGKFSETKLSACGNPLRDARVFFVAQSSDVTVIAARQWADSYKTLEQVLESLKFADAKVGGAVLLKDK